MKRYEYHCTMYDASGARIGSFSVRAATLGEALDTAGRNIEVKIRPDEPELRIVRGIQCEV